MEIVIFDTNRLYNKKATSFFAKRICDLQSFASNSEIYIPTIVIEELEKKYEREFTIEKEKFIKNILSSILSHDLNTINIEQKVAELKNNEKIQYKTLDITDTSVLFKMKDLAINKCPPFEAGEGTDKGFKDAYFYFTVLEFLRNIEDKYIFVCTKDKKLKEAFAGHAQVKIILDFNEFQKESIIQYTSGYFIEKIQKEVHQSLQKSNLVEYKLNIDNNHLIYFNEGTIIEVESGEILGYKNTNEFKANIDQLINSSNFSNTHDQIQILSEYIRYLSDEEITQILESTYYNSQIRWIIDDEDIKQFIGELFEKKKHLLNSEILLELEKILK